MISRVALEDSLRGMGHDVIRSMTSLLAERSLRATRQVASACLYLPLAHRRFVVWTYVKHFVDLAYGVGKRRTADKRVHVV